MAEGYKSHDVARSIVVVEWAYEHITIAAHRVGVTGERFTELINDREKVQGFTDFHVILNQVCVAKSVTDVLIALRESELAHK